MKKFMPLIALLVIAIFVMPTYAEPPIKQVEIVNLPENPVPVTTDDQLDVNVTNASPIPVTVDAGSQKTIVSAYIKLDATGIGSPPATGIIRTVPSDKLFILTDIVALGMSANFFGTGFFVNEDTATKPKLYATTGKEDGYRSLHLYSGIPFAPASDVIIALTGNQSSGVFTITGYDIDF